jgi:hypothetical protein
VTIVKGPSSSNKYFSLFWSGVYSNPLFSLPRLTGLGSASVTTALLVRNYLFYWLAIGHKVLAKVDLVLLHHEERFLSPCSALVSCDSDDYFLNSQMHSPLLLPSVVLFALNLPHRLCPTPSPVWFTLNCFFSFCPPTSVGIVRCIEKLLIACASMSYDLCYDAV